MRLSSLYVVKCLTSLKSMDHQTLAREQRRRKKRIVKNILVLEINSLSLWLTLTLRMFAGGSKRDLSWEGEQTWGGTGKYDPPIPAPISFPASHGGMVKRAYQCVVLCCACLTTYSESSASRYIACNQTVLVPHYGQSMGIEAVLRYHFGTFWRVLNMCSYRNP